MITMVFDMASILSYAAGLVIILLVCRLFLRPAKWLGRLLANGVFGGIMIFIVNMCGGFAGIEIAVNPVTALTAGVLGVPGVLLIAALQWIL